MSYYVTIPVASEQTGVSRLLIESAIREGQIPAWNCSGEAVVTVADVRDYRSRIIAGRECESCQ